MKIYCYAYGRKGTNAPCVRFDDYVKAWDFVNIAGEYDFAHIPANDPEYWITLDEYIKMLEHEFRKLFYYHQYNDLHFKILHSLSRQINQLRAL